jgi:hypothetical protein
MSKAAKRVHRLQLCRGPQDGGREHRLVALEVARLDQPQVRWHDVADVQDDNVTRDEVGDVDVGRSAVALVARRRICECRAAMSRTRTERDPPGAESDDALHDTLARVG